MTVKAPTCMDVATFSSGDNKTTSVGNTTPAISFHKIMKQSISSNHANSAKKDVSTDKNSVAGVSGNAKKQTANTDATKKNVSASGKNNTIQGKSNLSTSQIKDVSQKINQLAEDVKDKLEEELDISDKDLENIMQLLGITSLQLLQPENLRQVVLEASGQQDAAALLTNEDLLGDLNSVLQFLNSGLDQIAEDYNLSDEVLADMISDLQSENMPDAIQTDGTFDEKIAQATNHDDNVQDAHAENLTQQQSQKQDDTNKVEQADDTNDANDAIEVLKSKTTVTNNNDDATHSQTGSQHHNEHTLEQSNHPTENLSQASQNIFQTVQNTFATYMDGQTAVVDTVNVIRQVVDAIKITTGNQLQSIEIQLTPENLGKVNMTVSAKAGVITAQITAENEQVKKVIENQMTTLKQEKGIKVDAIEVTVRGHEFEAGHNLQGENESDQRQGRNTRRRINLNELNEFLNEDESEDDDTNRQILDGTSSVNYMA